MTTRDFNLVMMLAEKVGIKTAGELEDFKKQTQADTNEKLIKRLALYVACEMTFKEAVHYKK